MLTDRKSINLAIFIPEKYYTVQLKDYGEITEGVKHNKFKWTYDAYYEEKYLEELLLSGIILISRYCVLKVPNEIFGNKRSEKVRTPAKGARTKQLQSKDKDS